MEINRITDLKLCKYDNIDGWLWRCTKKYKKEKPTYCNCKISLRCNTFFSKSHLSLYQILGFALMWTKNYSLFHICEELSISGLQTGVDWNNFCREVVVYGAHQTNLIIGGPGVIVEIDESKVGKRKYNRGHPIEGQWVFGGVERVSGKCFIVTVPDRSKETLYAIIQKHIMPGSIIVSDFWKAYDNLESEGYTHFKVNHSKNFVDPVSGQHTNTVEGLWRHLKASIPEYNRRKHFFNGYIQKFIFLRWCRANQKHAYSQFLKTAGELYSPLCTAPVLMALPDDELLNSSSDEEPL